MLYERVLQGEVRASARLMRLADDRIAGYEEEMKYMYRAAGKAHVIGITGAPGAGKSTLTDTLITHYRKAGLSVGVVAIDPTSPFSGGAILGDRIRMAGHANDPEVFIRSVATRGHLGGLSSSTMDIVTIMDAMGKDVIIIETVGVGQDEVEIATVCDTCLVVTVPGLGDDIQAIKAGVFEIADIFVVNKADREGVERTARDLELMLEIGGRQKDWRVPVLKTVAARSEGIDTLVAEIARHKEAGGEEAAALRKRRRMAHIIYGYIRERLVRDIFPEEAVLAHVDAATADPYTVVESIWSRFIEKATTK